jgi:hypothetical protein
MAWSNLLSGIIGAVLGGLLAVVASVITSRQQRSLTLAAFAEDRRQSRLRSSYGASGEILSSMLTAKAAMYDVMDDGSDWSASHDKVRTTMERVSILYNPLIADEELRSRINDLIYLAQEWLNKTDARTGKSLQNERIDLVLPYMEFISQSIRAHLDDRALPPVEYAPDLPDKEAAAEGRDAQGGTTTGC